MRISAILACFVFLCGIIFFKEPHKPKIYDCFLLFNELEFLEARLSEMYNHIDKFVEYILCFSLKPRGLMLSSEVICRGAVNFFKTSALFASQHLVRTGFVSGAFLAGLSNELAGVLKKDELSKYSSSFYQWASLVYWIPSGSTQYGIPYIQPIVLTILGGYGLFITQQDKNKSEKVKFNHITRVTCGISKIVNVVIIGLAVAEKSKYAGILAATGLGTLSAYNFFKA